MKIKRIKEILIGSTKFKMKWDKSCCSGAFSFGDDKEKAFIEIGVKGINEEYEFDVLLHELSEIIHVVCHHRYQGTDCEDNYQFIMDHRAHTIHSTLLSAAIMKFIY